MLDVCRLEVARDVGAQDCFPRNIVAPRDIDNQRDVAVRARSQNELALRPHEAGHDVGPRIEAMAGEVEIVGSLRRPEFGLEDPEFTYTLRQCLG